MKPTLAIALILVSHTFCFSQQFEKVTDTPITSKALGSRSASFVDINSDNLIDVFITNGPSGGQNNSLFINQGNGNFVEDLENTIVKDNSPSDGATWGDIDNDGDIDLYVTNWYGNTNLFYLNDGAGNFEKMQTRGLNKGGHSETASWADYDKDGYLDLYVTNSPSSSGEKNFFVKNNGDGSFIETNSIINDDVNSTRNVNWIDFDNDGDLDVFLANEYNQKNKLYVNENGEFEVFDTGLIASDGEESSGSSWADYDNDGDLDLYVANFNQKNSFYRNDGSAFTKINDTGLTDESDYSFGTIWGDVDNDGDLDLFVSDGSFNTNIQNTNSLYLNSGDGTFTKVTDSYMTSETGWSFGAAFGDYDRDGFLDLIVARTYDQAQNNLMYHNLGNSNNWINIKCTGTVSNKAAIGAKVRIKATINGSEVLQMREVSSQSGYNCQNSLNVHFGLGDASSVTELTIEWPSGSIETFENLSINDFYSFDEEIPENFLRANFEIDDKEYELGEEVQFKNLSLVDTNQEVTYEWDFDNDGTIDSNDQQPLYAYPNPGTYDVNLTISNTNGNDEIIRVDYLTVNDETQITGIDHVITPSIKVYPNPSNDDIHIESHSKMIDMIRIFNLAGSDISTNILREIHINAHTTDVKNLPNGVYFLQIHLNDATIVRQRVIKQ